MAPAVELQLHLQKMQFPSVNIFLLHLHWFPGPTVSALLPHRPFLSCTCTHPPIPLRPLLPTSCFSEFQFPPLNGEIFFVFFSGVSSTLPFWWSSHDRSLPQNSIYFVVTCTTRHRKFCSDRKPFFHVNIISRASQGTHAFNFNSSSYHKDSLEHAQGSQFGICTTGLEFPKEHYI